MIGKTILHYKILEKLGEGGMGEVYRAEDIKLKREVALKFLPKEFSRDPEAKKRFIDEARSSSKLDHPNICVIYDINETDDGQLFISMNYCQGETLQNYLKEKELTHKETLKYITQIAKGLEKAHSTGIIHCDRKPGLLVVTDIDEERLARAASLHTPEEAKKQGIELKFVNTSGFSDVTNELKKITGGEGFDDVFVFAPVKSVIEQFKNAVGNYFEA